MLTDSMVDHKKFCGNYSICNELFSAMEDVIIEQRVTEERRHEGCGNCSGSLSIGHWREKHE